MSDQRQWQSKKIGDLTQSFTSGRQSYDQNSTSMSSSRRSSTTGSEKESQGKTGQQLSVIGYAEKSYPLPTVLPSGLAPADLSQLTTGAVDWLMQQVSTWQPSKGRLIDYIEASDGGGILPFAGAQIEHLMKPADVVDVGRALDAIIETLGCKTPSEAALSMYYEIFCEEPKVLIDKAAVAVLRFYKYKSMPNPADILNALNEYKEQYMGTYGLVTGLIRHQKILVQRAEQEAKMLQKSIAHIAEIKVNQDLKASTTPDTNQDHIGEEECH